MSQDSILVGDVQARAALLRGEHSDPHLYLGPHSVSGGTGVVVRARHPEAVRAEWKPADGRRKGGQRKGGKSQKAVPRPMTELGDGLFAIHLPEVSADSDFAYRLVFHFADGASWECEDPYRFAPTLSDLDLYFFSEGTHRRLWECLGARSSTVQGVDGCAFAVWAPNARRVSVVGDFCRWDGRRLPMRRLGSSGIFEIFVPGVEDGAVYKYEILGEDGQARLKADPLASWAQRPPETASRVFRSSYAWKDAAWMKARPGRDVRREPLAIYELHPGSWRRRQPDPPEDPHHPPPPEEHDPLLNYRELAPLVVEHVKQLGFNAIELLPISEHPFSGSWGYQVSGYYAPTSRHGSPDDFRFFVDHCHQHGIAVLLDWVPGHFVKDAHGLGRFDGSALYEHADPRQGLHPDWDTYIFNHARFEVRNFLISNALYWLEEFHLDGLRIDAVASMLYLDYSRKDGEWIPNRYGGRENLDAIALLRDVNREVHEKHPGCYTVAEESTAWPKVSWPESEGGLGFDLKWNMGWMHDTLSYFTLDPLFRAGSQDQLTFSMIYEHSEHFVNPLSHDEVVHGKGSLYNKMAGDPWRKFANLRALLAYQWTRPGKILLFMGSELATPREWNEEAELDWYLLGDPSRAAFHDYCVELGRLYHAHPCLWRSDPDPEGFQWVACHDHLASVLAYERRLVEADVEPSGGDAEHLVVVLNLTPVPREKYRLGAPRAGAYEVLLSSDDARWGGSGCAGFEEPIETEDVSCDGYRQSIELTLPPLAALVLKPGPKPRKKGAKNAVKKKS